MPPGSLVTKYLAGLALGSALVGGYVLVRNTSCDRAGAPAPAVVEAVPPAPVMTERAPDLEAARPTACDRYKRAADTFATCELIPQASRDAMKQAAAVLADNVARAEQSPAAASTMEAACEDSLAAVREAADGMGCPLK